MFMRSEPAKYSDRPVTHAGKGVHHSSLIERATFLPMVHLHYLLVFAIMAEGTFSLIVPETFID